MPVVLAYWDIRGLAQPIRLLLEYTGEDWEDKFYVCGPAPAYDKSCWIDVKHSLGLDFPNLPYLMDGDIKLVQSNAILRYFGRKHDMCGSTENERVRVDIMAEQAMDFRNSIVALHYGPKFEERKPEFMKQLPGRLAAFHKFLADHPWFAGGAVTFVDFPMYELLDQMRTLEPSALDSYPKLTEFMKRFEELPAIKKYMASARFMRHPINNPMAGCGGRKSNTN